MDVVWTPLITLMSGIIMSVVAWVLAKKKYQVEVTATEVGTLKESIDALKAVQDSLREEINHCTELANRSARDAYRVKRALLSVLKDACVNKACLIRQAYTDRELDEIFKTLGDDEDPNPLKQKLKNIV